MKRLMPTLVLLLMPLAASAQDRIGFANLELILALIPETKEVNQQLGALQQELARGLETKKNYAQQKLTEAQEAAASGVASEERLMEYETELRRLEEEIRTAAAEAEQKILAKRQELMVPVSEKLQTTIQKVAEADGYAFVLNSVDGSGTSIVLFGREEQDVTRRILEELGVETPDSPEPAGE